MFLSPRLPPFLSVDSSCVLSLPRLPLGVVAFLLVVPGSLVICLRQLQLCIEARTGASARLVVQVEPPLASSSALSSASSAVSSASSSEGSLAAQRPPAALPSSSAGVHDVVDLRPVKVRVQLFERLRDIISQTHSLRSPCYLPPPWAAGCLSNLCLSWVCKHAPSLYPNLRREDILQDDGETISIDFADCSTARALPTHAPVVIILPGVCSSGWAMRSCLATAARRGMRACVFNRRGLPYTPSLKKAKFNLVGCVADTRAQMARVRELYPDAWIGLVGVSAGAALVVNYLSATGSEALVGAACCVCPSYTWLKSLKASNMLVDIVFLASLKRNFARRHAEVLRAKSSGAHDALLAASTSQEFLEKHYVFAGCSSFIEYNKQFSPLPRAASMHVPVLVINSDDDLVCKPSSIPEHLFRRIEGLALLRTKRGSHAAFNEGLLGSSCFFTRVALDFLQTARRLDVPQSFQSNSDQHQDFR